MLLAPRYKIGQFRTYLVDCMEYPFNGLSIQNVSLLYVSKDVSASRLGPPSLPFNTAVRHRSYEERMLLCGRLG